MRLIWRLGVVLMASTVMMAQAPQIKPGLWEMTTVRNNGDGPPLKGKGKMCLTAADQEKMMHPENPKLPGCRLNVQTEAHRMTFDMTCTGKMQWQGHGSTTIVDAEHIETVMELNLVVAGATRRQVDRSSAHFVSAACGAVKPGEPPIPE